jgi:hypothetical protein
MDQELKDDLKGAAHTAIMVSACVGLGWLVLLEATHIFHMLLYVIKEWLLILPVFGLIAYWDYLKTRRDKNRS